MSYNILGINTSHNGSVCVLVDGKIDFFLEEDRITRIKHDSFPIKLIEYISKKYEIHEISISGLYTYPFNLNEHVINIFISKYFPNIKINYLLHCHHFTHASISFYNSSFKKALCVVIDGSGSESISSDNSLRFEAESIYNFSYNSPPQTIYKSYRTNDKKNNLLGLSKVYETITYELGFGILQAGKTMGLSSYGKPNINIPQLYLNTKGNPKVFHSSSTNPGGDLKNEYKYLLNSKELKQDLAYKVQQESQQAVGNLIEEAIKKTGLKQICCSGGYFLNCVTNYYLLKRFPNVEFYFEPISSDAGVAIGAAKSIWYQKTQDKNIRPQKTLYYGPNYTKKQLLEGIKKYV